MSISIWAWPSRGGLIELEHVTALDLGFLGLDPTHLDRQRNNNQEEEDKLCQRLLLLGAKWFDSEDRRRFISGIAEGNANVINELQRGEQPPPSTMERKWFSVAYPTGEPEGGFWLVEFDMDAFSDYGVVDHDYPPDNAPLACLARNMREKCETLQLEEFGGKFYSSLDDYDGPGCLNAWKQKTQGEFGPLELTTFGRRLSAQSPGLPDGLV